MSWDTPLGDNDCFANTDWNTMITFIKQSSICPTTIYDAIGGTQKFKFSYSGGNNTIEGDDTSASQLILKATTANTYPHMNLIGDAGIQINLKGSSLFNIFDESTSIYSVNLTGNYTILSGQSVTQKFLYLAATATDTYPRIIMQGLGDIWMSCDTGYVKFGTWLSQSNVATDGYILMKDNNGNVRKLATVA